MNFSARVKLNAHRSNLAFNNFLFGPKFSFRLFLCIFFMTAAKKMELNVFSNL